MKVISNRPKKEKFSKKKNQYTQNKNEDDSNDSKFSQGRSSRISFIKNKFKRLQQRQKLLSERKKLKKIARKERKEKEKKGIPVEKGITKTIESMQIFDETLVDVNNEEFNQENEADEFSDYFNGKTTPKLMITTSKHPTRKLYDFLKEIVLIIPNSYYYKRGRYRIKSIVHCASKNGFTDLLIFSENRGVPVKLYICHLPNGPTSLFKISSLKLAQDMKNTGVLNNSFPEIILNNFNTQIGLRIARQFACLFPQSPKFTGRRVITFHNQRDFIFFRHHRYIFRNKSKCSLQEIGPKLTLKLMWLQEGTFNTKSGDYEFIWRPDLQVDRKRMFM